MKDFDFIKNAFDQDQVQAPESLSAQNMLRLIENGQSNEQESAEIVELPAARPRRRWGYVAALAACLVAALVAIPVLRNSRQPEPGNGTARVTPGTFTGDSSKLAAGLETFENEDEISKLFAADWDEGDVLKENEDIIVDEAVPLAEPDSVEDKSSDYSQTYRQVDEVDEADIIKTDGEYIYHVTGYQEIEICRAENGKTEKVASISKFKDDIEIDNLYLADDRLIAVGSDYSRDDDVTLVIAYDVSDPAKPKELGHFEQTGYLTSSRLVDGVVYLVTEDYARKDHIVPLVSNKGELEKMDVKDICAFPKPDVTSYIVVSSIDFKTGEKIDSQTKAVLGASGDIYCNTENLYVASTDYSGSTVATRLVRTALDNGKLQFCSSGKVHGSIIGQFAMDEKDGYLRIATTADKNGKDVNNLYVLDGDLNEVGSVTGFARDEHIEAVRFIGDRAYIITYEQIDPLFILDLSDPADPKIDGEVEITGFSTLLVPVSDTKLVGIGYGTKDNGSGGEMADGLKIALFDISNPSKPEVVDAKQFPDFDSEAQYDHHALLQNAKKGYLAIPYSVMEELDFGDDMVIEDAEVEDEAAPEEGETSPEKDKVSGGVLVFTADNQIKVIKNYENKEESVRRCIYIGDYIYALDTNDQITGFKL